MKLSSILFLFLYCLSGLSAQDNMDTLLIDNFDDGDRINSLGGNIVDFSDVGAGGNSTIFNSPKLHKGSDSTGHCLYASWKLGKKYEYPFAGIVILLDKNEKNFPPAENYNGIRFKAKGSGSVFFKFGLDTTRTSYNEFKSETIHLNNVWNTYEIYFEDLVQEPWGRQTEWNSKILYVISFQADSNYGPSGEIFLDDIEFIKPAGSGDSIIAQKDLIGVFGKTVAVVGLESNVVKESTSSSLVDFLLNALVNVNRVNVIDRQSIDLILEEQQLQLTGITDTTKATEIGKILGVEFVVIANLSQIEDIYYLHVKMISVQTATIIGSTLTPANSTGEFLEMCNKGIDALFQKF